MKKKQYLIVALILMQSITHNLGHPVTPAFVRSLGIDDYMFGVFFATMSFGLMVGGPLWGALGDKGHKKTYIIIGLIMYSIGQFFFGYSNNQYLMVFFRFFSGFGVVASITLYTSFLIEVTEKRERPRFLAYIAAASTLGAALGYYLGGFISTNTFFVNLFNVTNYREIFLVQALINLIYVLIVFLLFKDNTEKLATTHKPNIFESFKYIKKMDPKLLLFLISLVFISIGATNLSKYVDVYFNELGYNPLELGTFVMVTGIVSLLTSIFLVPLFARIQKQIGLMLLLQVINAAIVFYVFRAQQFLLVLYTVYMVYVVFKAVYMPLEQNYISNHANMGEYGKIMGIRQSFLSIGMVLGPLIGGFLYELKPLLLFDSSAIAFLIAFLILLLICYLSNKQNTTDETLE